MVVPETEPEVPCGPAAERWWNTCSGASGMECSDDAAEAQDIFQNVCVQSTGFFFLFLISRPSRGTLPNFSMSKTLSP